MDVTKTRVMCEFSASSLPSPSLYYAARLEKGDSTLADLTINLTNNPITLNAELVLHYITFFLLLLFSSYHNIPKLDNVENIL